MSIPIHEQALLSAAGYTLASKLSLGDTLSTELWSQEIIDEANYTLRQKGLKIIPFGWKSYKTIEEK